MKRQTEDTKNLSRRSVVKVGVGAAALSAIGMPSVLRAAPTSLTVANAGGALGDAEKVALFDSFEKKTGIKVVSAPYLEGAKFKAMVLSGAVDIDVTDTDPAELGPLASEGLLDPIDYDVIKAGDLIPGAKTKFWVCNFVTASVLSWNTDAAAKQGRPKDWKSFFDPAVKGRRALWKNAAQTIELAALGAGQSLDSLYPIDLDAAFKKLDAIKSMTTWWTSGAQSAQLLADNEADYGMCWNGRIDPLKAQGAPVDYTFENRLHTWGSLCLPKGGRKKDIALKYIAHCMEPETQAALSRAIPYGPTRTSALSLLSDKERARVPNSPEAGSQFVVVNGDYWLENGAKIYDRFNTWLVSQ